MENKVDLSDCYADGSSTDDSLLDGFLNNTRTCTNTNNPLALTPCIYTPATTHTPHVFTSSKDRWSTDKNLLAMKPERPLGNRDAVWNYREKKMTQEAYVEEEFKKLRPFESVTGSKASRAGSS